MTDRELLEAAAKAAGYWSDGCWNGQPHRAWDPLADDGDALRLAVKLEIQSGYSAFSGEGVALWNRGFHEVREYGPDDPYAATRRAIVRAAAEIGRSKT
jgi:hypothetical protein